MHRFWSVLKWQLGFSKVAETHLDLPPYIPEYAEADLVAIKNPDPAVLQITWVGHATFLIQVGGMNVLTDPIWSERASPVSWLGPKRLARPGLRFENLPKIDAVVVSHTHYDHLDRATILRLGNTPQYVLQERTKRWFAKQGIPKATELSWWKSTKVGSITITTVPAKHWSKRNFFRTNDAGWGGFVIESPAGTVYFTGDTGYDPDYFKEIGKRFPQIRLALLPIGAYSPRWFMQESHIDPKQAVMIHREVGSRQSVAMHWATFNLSDEPMAEPPIILAREAAAAGLAPAAFTTLKIGETRGFR